MTDVVRMVEGTVLVRYYWMEWNITMSDPRPRLALTREN
jgi:hypothetical protein